MSEILNTDTARTVAKHLLDIEAIKLKPESPFQWASGWNSPIYCDNRLSLSYPEIRTYIKKELTSMIKDQFPEVEAIAGVATAGIPQGALVAEELGLPFLYVRSKPKSHGMTNCIEGKVIEGQKIVLVEDLISTGGSSIKASEELRKSNCNVLGMAAIFTYGFPVADENFKNADIKLSTLSNYSAMIDAAVEMGYVQDSQIEVLKKWRETPDVWGK